MLYSFWPFEKAWGLFETKSLLNITSPVRECLPACSFQGMRAAVKVLNGLDPEYDSLVAELNLDPHSIYSRLAALGGSVIPKLFGFPFCPDVDSRVLITEFVNGASLNLPTASKKVKLQALRGLEAIYSFGVWHNDLLAKSILLVKSNVYFIDFGCSTMDETQGSFLEELSYFREHVLRLREWYFVFINQVVSKKD
jgi:hypothetical protein